MGGQPLNSMMFGIKFDRNPSVWWQCSYLNSRCSNIVGGFSLGPVGELTTFPRLLLGEKEEGRNNVR